MSEALDAARSALAGERAWVVGGALRDRLLGRATGDVDLVVDGDPAAAAKRLARAVGGPAFELSDAFGAWRVIGPGRRWQADLTALRGGSLDADLALRDFTVNAIAEPLGGGEPHDPFGGAADAAARRLRMVSPGAFADDPLRVLRLARLAVTLHLDVEPETASAARAHAARLDAVAGERVFAELRALLAAPAPHLGIALLQRLGALAAVLPELEALRGVEQTVYHHLDAYGHTLEVLQRTVELQADPAAVLGPGPGERVHALLAEPLADELDRGGGLRWGALLHDAAKPQTATPLAKGGYGFPGHDALGADVARAVLARLRASERLRAHVAGLTRHHLRAGFLVHHRPLARRTVYAYLRACEPVAADVTLLSVADRLATRGRKAEEAIAKHLEVAGELLDAALDWHAHGPPPPLVRGDDLARELDLRPGPELGRLLAEVAAAQYAGELATREDAVAYARAARA